MVVGTAVVVVGGGGAFVVLVGGGGGGTVVVVVGGGLDQVLVQVYVVTQLGGGALGAPAGGSCLATAPAGLFGAARGVVRTGPPDPSLFELLSLLVSAFGAELAAGAGAPGAGAPGAAGVLGVEVPASAGGRGPVREVRNGTDAAPATVNSARAPARATCLARRDLALRHWSVAGSTSSGSAVRDGRWGTSAGVNDGSSDPAAGAEVSGTATRSIGASGAVSVVGVGSAQRAAPRAMAALGSVSMATGRPSSAEMS
ncbi:MAG: hypothetical protein WA731_11625, partial [Pseudonocardiaceae bacterium]